MFMFLKFITSKQHVKLSRSLTNHFYLYGLLCSCSGQRNLKTFYVCSCSGQRNLKTFYGCSASGGTKKQSLLC